MVRRIAVFFVWVSLVYGCGMYSEGFAGGSGSKPLQSKDDFAYDLIQKHIGDIKVGSCTKERINALVGVGVYAHSSGDGYVTEYIFYDNGRLVLGFGGDVLQSISFLSDKLVSVSVNDIVRQCGRFQSEVNYFDEAGQQGRVLNPDDHVAFITAHGGQLVGLYMGSPGQSYNQYLCSGKLKDALDGYRAYRQSASWLSGFFGKDLCAIL